MTNYNCLRFSIPFILFVRFSLLPPVLILFLLALPLTATSEELTTEADLPNIYESKILRFWDAYGQRHDFKGVDGVRIAAMLFRHPNSKAGIVISSGLGESFIKYREVVYDLWDAGYSVYILDHRGQGLSERLLRPTKEQQSDPQIVKRIHDIAYVDHFDDYVTDLKTFVDDLVKPNGDKRLFLLAHSMGGAIASLYLEKYRTDFSAAILSSPMHEPDLSPVPRWACWVFRIIGSRTQYAWGQGPYMEVEPFDPDLALTSSHIRYEILKRNEYRQHPEAQLGDPSNNWLYEACNGSRQARDSAGQIAVPVVIFQAGMDARVKARGQQEFCDGMNASHPGSCRIEQIAGGRHELLMETDKLRNGVLREALAFMTTQDK